jgi:hypothetical protein
VLLEKLCSSLEAFAVDMRLCRDIFPAAFSCFDLLELEFQAAGMAKTSVDHSRPGVFLRLTTLGIISNCMYNSITNVLTR